MCVELWASGFGGSVVVGFGEAGVGFSWLGCTKEGGVGVLVVVGGCWISRALVDKRRMDLHGSGSFTTGAERSEGARRPAIVSLHGDPLQETKIHPVTSDSSQLL